VVKAAAGAAVAATSPDPLRVDLTEQRKCPDAENGHILDEGVALAMHTPATFIGVQKPGRRVCN
jgi:hypothetical protein